MNTPGTLTATCYGKIILSGEYAVLFGHPGIAVLSQQSVTATFTPDPSEQGVRVVWEPKAPSMAWQDYVQDIIDRCRKLRTISAGSLELKNTIPLNRGMGSSTAFVIAVTATLLEDPYKKPAMEIEDALNPGHSGIDFAVIWNRAPILFRKGSEPQPIELPTDLLKGAELIDTGKPDQQTPELVAWIRSRAEEPAVRNALATIGRCTERIVEGESLPQIIRDHHQAQCALGIVTEKAKNMITKIEQEGGSAKVIGAGGRTGGSGMVLAFRNT